MSTNTTPTSAENLDNLNKDEQEEEERLRNILINGDPDAYQPPDGDEPDYDDPNVVEHYEGSEHTVTITTEAEMPSVVTDTDPVDYNAIQKKYDEAVRDVTSRLLSSIISKHHPTIIRAIEFATMHHKYQTRKSGEPYIIHPLNVALNICKINNADIDCIVAGLLHDCVEDTDVSTEDVEREFGKTVAFLVDGVTKLNSKRNSSIKEFQASNFRKMLIFMSKDIRVLFLKLADRLHNMQTIEALSDEKQKKIAQETLDIYAPLANKLGMAKVKWELEDLSFKTILPHEYKMISGHVSLKRKEREHIINDVCRTIESKLVQNGLICQVKGRPKHFYSIYQKIKKQPHTDYDIKGLSEIYDLLAVRIIVNPAINKDNPNEDCYKALSIIHSLWRPIPKRMKDYIAWPKPNGYQSLHTTVIGPNGHNVEFQIRTTEMNRIAEDGIAAHWKYKEAGYSAIASNADKEMIWLKELTERYHQGNGNENEGEYDDANAQIYSIVKNDHLHDMIFIYTPNGDTIELPSGATVLDFAYTIHTKLGEKCVGAIVDSKMEPIKTVLQDGSTVEILTSNNQTPKPDWLNYTHTNRAKSKIRNYLNKKKLEHYCKLGIAKLEKLLKPYNMKLASLTKNLTTDNENNIATKFNLKTLEDVIGQIGAGKVKPADFLSIIYPEFAKSLEAQVEYTSVTLKQVKKNANSKGGKGGRPSFLIDGIEGVEAQIAKCCNPIPGDDVVGNISVSRGIIIHQTNCLNLKSVPVDKLVKIQWNIDSSDSHYDVRMQIRYKSTKNTFNAVNSVVKDAEVQLRNFHYDNEDDEYVVIDITIGVHDRGHLKRVLNQFEMIEGYDSHKLIN